MNPYSVTVAPATRPRGWLVIVEFTMDVPDRNTLRPSAYTKGQRLARRYHYKKDADECAEQVLRDFDQAPQFYPYDEVPR